MSQLMVCPECGLPLVPFGGEDVCTLMCEWCEQHDCICEPIEDHDYDESDDDVPS